MGRLYSSGLPEEMVRRLYCDDGLSVGAVAGALGCSETAVRNRLVQLGIQRREPWAHNAVAVTTEELRRLYAEDGLSLSAVAAHVGCSLTTVWQRLTAAGVELRPDGSSPKYERKDFSGDALEKAYLIGFRLGDLHVMLEGNTVVVNCTSTKDEQVELFRRLFEPYGPIYTDERSLATRKRKSVGMYARLNRSFDFLLHKRDEVPTWVLSDDEALLAFFAGYADAEGYIQTRTPRGYWTPQVRLELRSADAQLLRQLADELRRMGIHCPPAAPRVAAGYVNGRGIVSRKTQWGLAVCSGGALLELFRRIDPYVKHGKRRADMERARSAILRKQKAPASVLSPDRRADAGTAPRRGVGRREEGRSARTPA